MGDDFIMLRQLYNIFYFFFFLNETSHYVFQNCMKKEKENFMVFFLLKFN